MIILACCATIPTLFLNKWAIIVGKFALGLASGSIIVASSIYLNETVPVEKSSLFGFSINFGVVLGMTICFVLGLSLPNVRKD